MPTKVMLATMRATIQGRRGQLRAMHGMPMPNERHRGYCRSEDGRRGPLCCRTPKLPDPNGDVRTLQVIGTGRRVEPALADAPRDRWTALRPPRRASTTLAS